MLPRAATVGLLAIAAAADGFAAHTLAFWLLLVAVPVAATAALGAFGELVDAFDAADVSGPLRLQVLLGVLVLVLAVVGAAGRAVSLGDAVVPIVSTAAVVALLALGLVRAGASAGTGLQRFYARLRTRH
jgi:hypothetical protein